MPIPPIIIFYISLGGTIIFIISSLVMPKKYKVKKTAIINRPVNEVINKVADLHFYDSWNPWQQVDPTTTKTVTGTPRTVGHKYSWTGKKSGEGSFTLSEIDGHHIHFDLEFEKPWKSHAKDSWLFEEQGDHATKITWQNTGDLRWPFARIMGPWINMNLNRQFEKGLNNLKKICEEN